MHKPGLKKCRTTASAVPPCTGKPVLTWRTSWTHLTSCASSELLLCSPHLIRVTATWLLPDIFLQSLYFSVAPELLQSCSRCCLFGWLEHLLVDVWGQVIYYKNCSYSTSDCVYCPWLWWKESRNFCLPDTTVQLSCRGSNEKILCLQSWLITAVIVTEQRPRRFPRSERRLGVHGLPRSACVTLLLKDKRY